MPPTDLLYLSYEGNFALSCTATVLSCLEAPAASAGAADGASAPHDVTLVLDRTVLHPCGGGQPSDIGRISATPPAPSLDVSSVSADRATGVVAHAAARRAARRTTTPPGQRSRCPSMGGVWQMYSECHTAGHVVDATMDQCGLALVPTKGYHILEAPYVEYQGKIDAGDRAGVLARLQQHFKDLVDEDIPTTISVLPVEDAEK